MTARKRSIKSDLTKVDAHRITKAEYDEAPEFTKEMLDRAEIRHGNRIIKRGRPPIEHPKEAVKLRLDHDVLAAYRKTGSGWQTRINADLRKAARKLEHDPEKWKPVFRGDHAQTKR
jgi:uncharacterized protein (DUF4415 family)